jgi:protocatechuate 3,4-dioxygenase beta subunit
MERRDFIGAGAALAALAAPKWLGAQACPSTEEDRYGIGPFYLENAPARTLLGRTGEPGEKLSLSGRVSNCQSPLSGVKLEVWQATASGCYIHPDQACDNVPGDDTAARLWGHLVSDAEGRFAFDTIKPGRYLNGGRFRPSHIHCLITTPGRTPEQGDLYMATQLYFQGDPYIQGDYGADDASAAGRIIPLATQAGGGLSGEWNINLPNVSPTTGLGRSRDPLADPALAGFDVAYRRSGWRVLFQLPPVPSGQAVEMRLSSLDGRLVKRSLHSVLPVELDVTFLPKGTYHAEFRWWAAHGLRRESVALKI